MTQSSGGESSPASVLIAKCLVMEGQRLAREGNKRDAWRSYMESLLVGCDLGTGNLVMNVGAVAIAKRALDAMGNLVLSTKDEVVLGGAARQLASVESRLPSLKNGLQFERLQLADGIRTEAEAYVSQHEHGLGQLGPWRAIAEWRATQK